MAASVREQRPRRQEREKRPDSWADTPAKPDKREPRKDQPRSAEPKPHQQQPGGRVGFADSMPAFMRKPPRPSKTPGGR